MSNKTQLQTNNTQLASLIQELANKAAGGGGAAVETCTVQINGTLMLYGAGATVYKDGEISMFVKPVTGNTEMTISDVVCNSMVVVNSGSGVLPAAVCENGEVTLLSTGVLLVKVTAPAGGTSTITTYDAD